MVTKYYLCKKLPDCFLKSIPFLHSRQQYLSVLFALCLHQQLVSSVVFLFCFVFSHFNRCVVLSFYGFNLHASG